MEAGGQDFEKVLCWQVFLMAAPSYIGASGIGESKVRGLEVAPGAEDVESVRAESQRLVETVTVA